MEKFSVQKPFTVLVAILMVLTLGVVSITSLKTDLLPDMNVPVLAVVTVYPGASPERVESDITEVMEAELGTVSGVETLESTSAENYSLIQMRFTQDADMNSAMVKVSNALDQLSASLPSTAMTPQVVEISIDMMATMNVAVTDENKDIYELSDYINETIKPYLERQAGVSSVSESGLVTQVIQIELNQDKIDAVNDRVLGQVNEVLGLAQQQLEDAQALYNEKNAEFERTKDTYGDAVSEQLFAQISAGVDRVAQSVRGRAQELLDSVNKIIDLVNDPTVKESLMIVRDGLQRMLDRFSQGVSTIDDLIDVVTELRTITEQLASTLEGLELQLGSATSEEEVSNITANIQLIEEALNTTYATLQNVVSAMNEVPKIMGDLQNAYAELSQAQLEAALQFTSAQNALSEASKQLEDARTQYEQAREQAYANADVNNLLTLDTLSTLIYAQNFSMPAGYIDDADDNAWLLKVGEEYDSVSQLEGTLLTSVEGVGSVYLDDVADVAVVDDYGQVYAKLSGSDAVVLSVYKGSTASTTEVTESCENAFSTLQQQNPGLKFNILMNQGSYINQILQSVLSSMVVGAALAIFVLIVFLKDVKPTIVVGISIPLSVLTAVVLMYFAGMTINMMTLCGLSLGIGMLVDNSIVVIENIYRLRNRGVAPARAAVQGARQVEGSIIASTVTTVAAFVPMVFLDGTERELLIPMTLCISFCLLASLVVALTVVPAASSTLLRSAKAQSLPWFDRVLEKYEQSVCWCINHKKPTLIVTTLLLAFCVWQVVVMGVVMLPEMNSVEVQMEITTPEGITREQAYERATQVMEAALAVDGVAEVGVTTGSGTDVSVASMVNSLATTMLGGDAAYNSYTAYVILEDKSASNREVSRLCEQLREAVAEIDATVEVSAGGLADLVALTGSGLTVNIYGSDNETTQKIAADVIEMVNATEGFANATTGLGEGDPTIHLQIDRDKAMACGITVAQIYQQLAARLTTSTTSTAVSVDGKVMNVQIVDVTDPLTLENLLDTSFTTSTLSADGTTVEGTHTLREFAEIVKTVSPDSITRYNQMPYISVTAETLDGYNTSLQARALQQTLDDYRTAGNLPEGYSIELGGETSSVNNMLAKMGRVLFLGLIFIYLVMVAQFQSLLSPFIVLFTIPLAFTGGLVGLLLAREQLSLTSLMGFIVLMGTVVNNGIVFVDYANLLRLGGMERIDALVATGKTRMRPILMTALTTILAMIQLMLSDDMAGQLMRGMAIVIVGGLTYATFMTLYILPVMYDILFKKAPHVVDVGGDEVDDVPDDAAEFLAQAKANAPAPQPVADAPAGGALPVAKRVKGLLNKHDRSKK